MKRKYEIAVLSMGDYARTLRIYAPKSADRAIIMHDGQNVFYDEDAAYKKSWRTLDLIKECGAKNTAIIGIDCTETRLDDYLPFPIELEQFGKKAGGNTDVYCDYISSTVFPYLEKRFNFKHYAMLGSSAGSTATLYYAAKKDPKIKAYGLFSPPLFLCPSAFDKFLNETKFDSAASYYVYVGGKETADAGEYSKLIPDLYVDAAHILVKGLRRGGATSIRARLENDAVHDEVYWRKPALEFISDFSKAKF
ncbi:MAG: hypothetical protein J1F33_02330 [Clostridiales bacterium]|nr:hypothetical protein [Clostridiales bacterium]